MRRHKTWKKAVPPLAPVDGLVCGRPVGLMFGNIIELKANTQWGDKYRTGSAATGSRARGSTKADNYWLCSQRPTQPVGGADGMIVAQGEASAASEALGSVNQILPGAASTKAKQTELTFTTPKKRRWTD